MSKSTPSQGSHFSDGVRTGPILGSTYTPGANVLTPSVMVSSPADQLPPGIFNTPMSLLDIIPAPYSSESIAALQTIAAAGYLNLVSINGIGINVITYNSIPNVIQLDCARNVVIQGTAGVTPTIFTIFGWDQYGVPMVEQITGPTGGAIASGNKAFLYIQAVYASSSPGGTGVSVGVGNTFGLPYLLAHTNHAFVPYWNGFPDAIEVFNDEELLANDPITTTNGSSDVVVSLTGGSLTITASDLVVGQWVQLFGVAPFAGISTAEFSIEAQIKSLDVANNTFTYTVEAIANASASGGGNAVNILLFNGVVTGDQRPATATTRDVRGTYTPLPATFGPFSNANGQYRLTINFYNGSGDARNYNNALNGTVNLNDDPLTTYNGTLRVDVFAPNHQFTTEENVTISGATDTNNISAAQLNITAPVTVINEDEFTYTAAPGNSANATGQGGGSVVNMTPRYGDLYQTSTGRFGVSQYSIPLF